MSRKTKTPQPPRDPLPVSFTEALGERYLSYALSIITARSLPDVRDGLKPVAPAAALRHARAAAGRQPGAEEVGPRGRDVIGRYHPHGDQAVYDAMVRLAQDFAVRYPLVDRPGQFRQHRRRQRRGHAIHRGAADRGRGGSAGRDRPGRGRFPRHLRRRGAGAGAAAGRHSPTCWPMVPRASRLGWRPRSRRTMSTSCAGR